MRMRTKAAVRRKHSRKSASRRKPASRSMPSIGTNPVMASPPLVPSFKPKTVAEARTAPKPEFKLADYARATLEHKQEFKPFNIVPRTAQEWCDAPIPPPVEFLGDRLWHSQTKGMFVMRTDRGKTHWSVALGLHMAMGKSFCDWTPQRKARGLYIEGETPSYLVQETIRLQCKALGVERQPSNLRLISASTEKIPFLNVDPRRKPPSSPYDGLKWLDERLKEWRPDFIIFDNLAALCPVMVSASARGWIEQMMNLVITPLNLLGIGQLWLHHPDKSGKVQHGTGARNWGLHLELFGEPVVQRGIGFNIRFGKKKGDKGGNNPSYDDRYVGFEDGVWIVDEPRPPALVNSMDVGFGDSKLMGRPNLAAIAVMKALTDTCKASPDGWASPEPDGQWYAKAVEEGVSESENKDNRRQAFVRTVKVLMANGIIERDIITSKCRPMPREDDKPHESAGKSDHDNVIYAKDESEKAAN